MSGSTQSQSGTSADATATPEPKKKRAPRKTVAQQLAELEQKQAELEAKAKMLKAKVAEQERKSRTRRLIQLGAVVESVFERQFDDPAELKNLLTSLRDLNKTTT